MGSKGENHATARGPPESAEGRSSDEGEGECFAPFYLKIINFCVKMLFFLVLERFQVDLRSSSENRQIFKCSSKFSHFLRHISCPEQVFPWSNRAHIKQAQSSNIVLKQCLRIP